MAITVAVLRAIMTLDASRFYTNIRKADDALTRTGKVASAVGSRLSLAVSAPLALLGAEAIRVTASFEQQMNILQAVTKASASEMAALTDQARRLGRDLELPGVTAKDAAEGLTELAKGGLSAKEASDALRGTLQLSVAASVDQAQAARIVVGALNAFNLEGSEAARVADLMAAGANAAQGEIKDIGLALRQSSAAFKVIGASVEDATTAITLMAKAGVLGSDSGTSLKNAILRLLNPSKQAKAALKLLGIELVDANGRVKPFRDIVDILSEKMAGLSEANRVAFESIIGGADAFRALEFALGEGVEVFDEMKKKVTEQGAAQTVAAAKAKGLAGAISAMSKAFTSAAEAGISVVSQDLVAIAKSIAGVVNTFAELPQSTRRAIMGFGVVLIAIGPLLVGLGNLFVALSRLKAAFLTIRGAVAAASAFLGIPLGPIGLLIAAIGALVVAWINNWGSIQEVTNATLNVIGGTIVGWAEGIIQIWTAFTTALSGNMQQALQEVKSGVDQMRNAVSSAMKVAADDDVRLTEERLKKQREAAARMKKDAAHV